MLGVQLLLGYVSQAVERADVVHGQVGKNLAVHFDAGLLQAEHEFAVGQAVQTRSGVDADDPQLAEVALPLATVAVRVQQGFVDLLLCGFKQAMLGTEVTLCELKNPFAATGANESAFTLAMIIPSCRF